MEDKNYEIWLRMYEEQVRHGRHHEVLRSQSTNMVLAISAALLAFISSDYTAAGHDKLVSVFIVVINVYGLIMSLKHYERSRLHVGVAGKYRDVVSELSEIDGKKINDVRKVGKAEHITMAPYVHKIRVYVLWCGLHLVLAIVGLMVLQFGTLST